MKKVLLIVFSNLKNDARMLRHLDFISKSYDVTACCFGAPPTEDYKVHIIQNRKVSIFHKAIAAGFLLLKRFSWAHRILFPFKEQLSTFKDKNFDLIIANDIETLPFAFQLKGFKTKILFDAHEYAPRHFEDKLWWRIFFMDFNYFLCKKYIPLTDGMITVSQSIAEEYEKNFGKKPLVITNATHYRDLSPVKNSTGTVRLVHHGIVGRSRKIELIVNIMEYLPDNYTLDLVLVVPVLASQQTISYLEELKKIRPADKRVRFIDPVPVSQVVPMLQNYDMGIILAPPINFNYINGMPNKLFDFVQGRIGVVSGPTKEIANVIKANKIGVVSEGFTSESLAKAIASLSMEDIEAFKTNSHRVARALSADHNKAEYTKLVKTLLD